MHYSISNAKLHVSTPNFELEKKKIRFGFSAQKNLKTGLDVLFKIPACLLLPAVRQIGEEPLETRLPRPPNSLTNVLGATQSDYEARRSRTRIVGLTYQTISTSENFEYSA
jgi:hypothetical protein